MKESLRYLLPAWIGCVVLPLPILFFWWSPEDGRIWPLGLFFVGCASLVAYSFQGDLKHRANDAVEDSELLWRKSMVTAGTALLFAAIVFSLIWLVWLNARDYATVFLAFAISIPSLCIVPYLTLLTRKPVAAVLFTLFAVFGMKLLGCVVVVLVYGWHADTHVPPYTDMPWEHPNLLVWVFLLNTAVLSLWFYILARRRFLRICKVEGELLNRNNQTPTERA